MTRVHGSLGSRIQLRGNALTVLESNHIGQRGQLLPHYQTIITLGFSNFAIDSFINEIYFPADTDDSLYSLFKFSPFLINPWTYTQIHIPTVVQGGGGGWMEPPRDFDMLQYFETILPSVESLWSSLQDEVYFMGGGAAGGLWRSQQWSPFWRPCWILPRIRNRVKFARNGDFFCLTWKITLK